MGSNGSGGGTTGSTGPGSRCTGWCDCGWSSCIACGWARGLDKYTVSTMPPATDDNSALPATMTLLAPPPLKAPLEFPEDWLEFPEDWLLFALDALLAWVDTLDWFDAAETSAEAADEVADDWLDCPEEPETSAEL